jgi:hypothetical protein
MSASRILARWLWRAGLAGLLAAGCGHARSVENPASAEAAAARQNGKDANGKDANGKDTDGKAANGKVANDTPPSDQRHPAPSAHAEPPHDQGTIDPAAIPVSTSAAGQLKEDGAKKIQQRLTALGFLDQDQQSGDLDDRTGAALRKFQKSHDLAATGTPDAETVRKLSLDPQQIFRAAR